MRSPKNESPYPRGESGEMSNRERRDQHDRRGGGLNRPPRHREEDHPLQERETGVTVLTPGGATVEGRNIGDILMTVLGEGGSEVKTSRRTQGGGAGNEQDRQIQYPKEGERSGQE